MLTEPCGEFEEKSPYISADYCFDDPYVLQFYFQNGNIYPVITEDAEFEIVEPKLLENDKSK